MKNLITFILLISCGLAKSQEKKDFYYNFKGKEITKGEFLLKLNNKDRVKEDIYNMKIYLVNDSSNIYILHPRKIIGKLRKKQLSSLKNYFIKSHKKTILEDHYIVINYYSAMITEKREQYLPKTIYHKNYQRRLNRLIKNQQFFMCDKKESVLNHKLEDKYLVDKNYVIKSLFFPYDFPDGSFVIIKPDGRFITIYGEYGKTIVWDVAKEISKKDR